MTTENEKIAGYIVPEIYNRFEQFCKENNLTCSRGLNVIIAEYFGMEETLIFKQTWAGGITLPEFEKLKQEVEELKELVNTLSNKQSITPQTNEIKEEITAEIPKKIKKKVQKKVEEGLSKKGKSNEKGITQKLNTSELAKRFNISRATINRHKKKLRENKITREEYIEWTKTQDPEGKGWFFDENTNYSV